MYLKKLEISGFKSFANKTILEFPSGVTAIVGPNGSGKSNIADAVSWVLGEQSMKSLRGKKSEDVIFTGSDKKSKMSAAFASLFLDNSDKKIPLDYQEVVIARKLFRNGESEYMINKNQVRLIDIADLLAKSGISKRGYCVINQGMADSILAATPAERMVIFEEATGVRSFQIKKQQTINKLESTARNLEQVLGLLNEIEPRLGFLRRQAAKAQKRGEVEENLKLEQKKLYSNIWKSLNCDNRAHNLEKRKWEEAVKNISAEVENIKSELAKDNGIDGLYQSKFEQLQKELSSLQEAANSLQKELSIIEGRIEIEEEQKKKMEIPEFAPINLGYVKEKLSNILLIYDKLLVFIENLADLRNVQSAKDEGRKVRNEVELLLCEIKEGKVSQKSSGMLFDGARLEKFELERKRILEKIKKLSEKHEEIKAKIQNLNTEEREKRRSFFQLERKLQNRQDELNGAKDNLNGINIELAKFDVRKEDLFREVKEELGNLDLLEKNSDDNFASSEVIADNFNQEESRLKIKRLKIKLEQIGGIDPLVMEEYNETQKRFEFLSAQSNDLIQSSESLKKIIKELDEKIENRFKSSFQKINEEFNRYFKVIFGGGKASLSIIYSVDEEEGEDDKENENGKEKREERNKIKKIAGIEINAAPPGKRISSLSMLSGGERALASIAILFAIISNNPPPFSVLDEIDAALDEANSMRLAKIIKEISGKTQFVIITHNREIMKQAEILYGVTMQDDGVSKIVSLKLEGEMRG